jgi:hypothetical protein
MGTLRIGRVEGRIKVEMYAIALGGYYIEKCAVYSTYIFYESEVRRER